MDYEALAKDIIRSGDFMEIDERGVSFHKNIQRLIDQRQREIDKLSLKLESEKGHLAVLLGISAELWGYGIEA